jgi:UDP-N-acetylglucosamine--N-acetylmuramyl-(pentapeptide) pyrophosphoryl-undecaprenol N-acetylglucosamine transferase
MRVAVACGGTGGHIFPGLATADELMRRGHDVTLWLAGKDVENEAVKGWAGKVITVPAQGFPSGFSPKAASAAFKLIGAIRKVKTDMSSERPDVVLAMGSYASVGPVGAAIRLNIPFVMHESNVIPGRAVRLFSRWAAVIAGCFDETRFYLRRRNLVMTGMPLRRDLLAATSFERPSSDRLRILVMGGSRGAKRVNELVSQAAVQLHVDGLPISLVHLTGESDRAHITARYAEAGVSAEVFAFTREIGKYYARSDMAICRSGAATCAELSAFGLPSLLVPYPHAIHDHQTANARAMEKVGAADMVPEKDVSVEWLVSYINQMYNRPERRQQMSDAARTRSTGDGAARLAALVEKIATDPSYAEQ